MYKGFKLLNKRSDHKSPASFSQILEVGKVNKNNMKNEDWYVDHKLKQFNCYKHKFTNYKELVDAIYYGDYDLKQGIAILQHIYHQLLECDVPEDYKPVVALAFRFGLKKYKQFIAQEQRLTHSLSVL